MKWISREKVKVDRVAREFIEYDALYAECRRAASAGAA
jgi:hypothetical protein